MSKEFISILAGAVVLNIGALVVRLANITDQVTIYYFGAIFVILCSLVQKLFE